MRSITEFTGFWTDLILYVFIVIICSIGCGIHLLLYDWICVPELTTERRLQFLACSRLDLRSCLPELTTERLQFLTCSHLQHPIVLIR
jgi:hypothetical protein